jgi:ParB family chromosome partitioning protein
MLRVGSISAGHARALLALPPERREPIAQRIVRDGLTVRAVEKLGRQKAVEAKAPAILPAASSSDREELLERLRYLFAAHVAIAARERGGVIEIRFSDDADLQRITDLLFGHAARA